MLLSKTNHVLCFTSLALLSVGVLIYLLYKLAMYCNNSICKSKITKNSNTVTYIKDNKNKKELTIEFTNNQETTSEHNQTLETVVNTPTYENTLPECSLLTYSTRDSFALQEEHHYEVIKEPETKANNDDFYENINNKKESVYLDMSNTSTIYENMQNKE
ncbi:hypothetical protein EHP00_791 [Ecytonucleospora hepatopenaei]|uniref:Uncharacterized protein n=1 Tax=Ecytonucleospora hepatopenaei TaxID=646526 RepID=A0A1W0E854_9MICR|nr:hypothetical protein EHP00_791 [Ecytonucleospora hepatopenaei]